MAHMASSATEHALENQRLGGLQIRVAVICGLIQMCDGYDVGPIGWSVPSLTHAWHVAPSAFTLAFLWSNIGVMAGALAAGPIGDRLGRKPPQHRDRHEREREVGRSGAFGGSALGSPIAVHRANTVDVHSANAVFVAPSPVRRASL